MAPRKNIRRGRKGKKSIRRGRKTGLGLSNSCRITETFDVSGVLINQPYEYRVDGISAGTRAAEVAKAFGLYRIAQVMYTYKPYYDTYTPALIGSGNFPTTVPNLYWRTTRYGDAPAAFNDDYLKEMGAKAIRLDDKAVVVSYKPNILLADAGAIAAGLNGGSGQVKMTPWLSTDSQPGDGAFQLSSTIHYGHIVYVEGNLVNGSTQPNIASLEVRIIYEFKNPRGLETHSSQQMPLKQTVSLTKLV